MTADTLSERLRESWDALANAENDDGPLDVPTLMRVLEEAAAIVTAAEAWAKMHHKLLQHGVGRFVEEDALLALLH